MPRVVRDDHTFAADWVAKFNHEVGGCLLCSGFAKISNGRVSIDHYGNCPWDWGAKRRRAVQTVEAPLFKAAD